MGRAGALCAQKYHCTREAQDAFATESYGRAMRAAREGSFRAELVPVVIPGPKGTSTEVTEDEEPGRGKPEKFGELKPAFKKDGTITAANASSINDGAAALVLASEKAVKSHGLEPLARIDGWAGAAQAPAEFTTAPARSIEKA